MIKWMAARADRRAHGYDRREPTPAPAAMAGR